MNYSKADIEELTVNEFYEVLKMLPRKASDEYVKDLTKFAWLAQYISQMMGGESKVYQEMLKSLTDMSTKGEIPDEVGKWKSLAKSKGLKIGGE